MLGKKEEENRKTLDGAALNSQRNRASTVAPGDRNTLSSTQGFELQAESMGRRSK